MRLYPVSKPKPHAGKSTATVKNRQPVARKRSEQNKASNENEVSNDKKLGACQRLSGTGDEIFKQLDKQLELGWVEVNLALLSSKELDRLFSKVLDAAEQIDVLRMVCFPRDYDRAEVFARKMGVSHPAYNYSSEQYWSMFSELAENCRVDKVKTKLTKVLQAVLNPERQLVDLSLGLRLSNPLCSKLSTLLGENTNLRKLSLAGSFLGDDALQLLEAGLRGNTSIRHLDLTACALTDASAPILARLINARTARRAVEEWHGGLREYPDLSLEPRLRRALFRQRRREIAQEVAGRCGGLLRLQLAQNKLSDRGAGVLLEAVRTDAFLRVLGLRDNQITPAFEAEAAGVMQRHRSLLRVDLRGSAGGAILQRAGPKAPLTRSPPSSDLPTASERESPAHDAQPPLGSPAIRLSPMQHELPMQDAAPHHTSFQQFSFAAGQHRPWEKANAQTAEHPSTRQANPQAAGPRASQTHLYYQSPQRHPAARPAAELRSALAQLPLHDNSGGGAQYSAAAEAELGARAQPAEARQCRGSDHEVESLNPSRQQTPVKPAVAAEPSGSVYYDMESPGWGDPASVSRAFPRPAAAESPQAAASPLGDADQWGPAEPEEAHRQPQEQRQDPQKDKARRQAKQRRTAERRELEHDLQQLQADMARQVAALQSQLDRVSLERRRSKERANRMAKENQVLKEQLASAHLQQPASKPTSSGSQNAGQAGTGQPRQGKRPRKSSARKAGAGADEVATDGEELAKMLSELSGAAHELEGLVDSLEVESAAKPAVPARPAAVAKSPAGGVHPSLSQPSAAQRKPKAKTEARKSSDSLLKRAKGRSPMKSSSPRKSRGKAGQQRDRDPARQQALEEVARQLQSLAELHRSPEFAELLAGGPEA